MDMALRRRVASGADFTHTAVSAACDASVLRVGRAALNSGVGDFTVRMGRGAVLRGRCV